MTIIILYHTLITFNVPSSYIINAVLTIRLVPPTGGVGVPNYQIPENSGPIEICVEVVSGSLAPGQTATVVFSTSDGSALRKMFCVSLIFIAEK